MHECSAGNCGESIPRWKLFCDAHWRRLPYHMRAGFKDFQMLGPGFVRRRDYHDLRRQAIAFLDAEQLELA